MARPNVNGEAQKELDKTEASFDEFKSMMKSYNPLDNRMSPKEEEPVIKMSNRDMNKMDAPVIRPIRSVNRVNSEKAKTYWNEKYQKMHDYDWEYVKCKVENREIINEDVETWTAKYGCDPAHLWRVPVNKPVWIPRLLASQLAQCKYNKIIMQEEKIRGQDGMATYTGTLEVEQTINRINCTPVAASF
jgi:hypothetical protein